MAPIEIYQDYGNVKRGKYWLHQFADFRAYSAVIKTLKQCEFKTSKFSYALFRTEIGFAVRRKLRAISEQEQDWEDVAEIWPFELGAIADYFDVSTDFLIGRTKKKGGNTF